MPRMLRRIALEAPHPLREYFCLWFVTFWAAFLLSVLHLRGPLRPVVGLLGGTGMLLGLTLAGNIAGAAVFWAQLATRHRPMGVDYSQSVSARPRFVRLFGLAFAAVGLTFVIGSLTGSV